MKNEEEEKRRIEARREKQRRRREKNSEKYGDGYRFVVEMSWFYFVPTIIHRQVNSKKPFFSMLPSIVSHFWILIL